MVDVLVVRPLDCLNAVWAEGDGRLGFASIECEPIVRGNIKGANGREVCDCCAVCALDTLGGRVGRLWPDDWAAPPMVCTGDAAWAETQLRGRSTFVVEIGVLHCTVSRWTSRRRLDEDFQPTPGTIVGLPSRRKKNDLNGTVADRESSIDWRAGIEGKPCVNRRAEETHKQ